jgi:plasmid stability protein
MKVLKVHDDIHRDVKVAAAEKGRTTTNVASALLRWALDQLTLGKVKLDRLAEAETSDR